MHLRDWMRKRSLYTWAAIGLLAVPIVTEGLRLVLNRPWPGFVPWNSHVVSALVVVTFTAAIAAMIRGARATVAERALAVAAPLVISGHAFVVTTAKNRIGLLYIPLALLFVFVAQRAFRAEQRIVSRPATREVLRGRLA